MKMDKVIIRDLLVRGIIGINPDERVKKQDILVNIVFYTDISRAAASDDIADAANYKDVSKKVFDFIEESSFLLVERLVTEIARLILTDFPVSRVQVRVEKPGALRFARSVGIEIDRFREDFGLTPL
ncbi:MAG: dihydroneopterin aldolase [Anaerolineae bacterium]|nr:dihydroneopterin aldolase [Anaerolineae bacterium]RIK17304.1 MAG: dihydroneopterin aldolase [Anaerolineae bacterium]